MRILYMIHRGESSFEYEKTFYRCVFEYFLLHYPKLQFDVDKKQFSFRLQDVKIEFEYGYLNLLERDFEDYDFVISSGLCAILNLNINPGDILFASRATSMDLDELHQQVILDDDKEFSNPMQILFTLICKQTVPSNLKEYIQQAHKDVLGSQEVKDLRDLVIVDDARMIAASGIFLPSKLRGWDSFLKTKPIDLQNVLTQKFDGLNCETMDMMKRFPKRTVMYSVGVDKPYADKEFSGAIRDETRWRSALPEMELATIYLFKYLIIGSLLQTQGSILNKLDK